MADNSTTIAITGKVNYDDTITVAQAAQIIAFLNPADEETATLGGPSLGDSSGQRGSSKKVENAREAINVSGAKTIPEKIVALAGYVLQDGGETFKADAIKVQFQRAREPMPGNFTRDMTSAITSGWVAEGEAGEFYLTSKVEGVLDGGFSFAAGGARGGRTRQGTRSRSTAPKKVKEKPTVFAAIDEFSVTMDGFPAYNKMKSNKDKLLWAVKFAKTHDIKGLSVQDIAWLTDHLGDGIPARQVSAAFTSARGPGYANRSTLDDTIRIGDDGETYLATVGLPSKA